MDNQFETDWSKWKLLGLTITLQAVSFASGLYSGHTFWPKQSVQVVQPNYSTTQSPETTTTIPLSTNTNNSTAQCPIKGNISGKNKIYHLQEGAFYERTQAEMCFQTEAEAAAAGFIKSSR